MLDQPTGGVFKMKLSEENKFQIVQLREDGCSIPYIAKKFQIDESHVKRVIKQYQLNGSVDVLHTTRVFTPQFKYEIVQKVLSGESIHSFTYKYRISHASILRWVQKYKEEGYNGLKNIKKGRPKKMNKSPKEKSNPLNDKERKELEELREKVKYLEMESEYLKKLNALVQKRQAKQQRKK